MNYRVLNLGAGIQSSRILLGSCLGELPKFDAVIFSDTGWEPKAVYDHLAWLETVSEKAGMKIHKVTAGNIREDALAYRQNRKSADGKRFASLPFFIRNPNGSDGIMPRQCTREYKIEPIEKWIRRELLGLAPGKRIPKGVTVERWYGISDDEASRAAFPGQFKTKEKVIGQDLYGQPVTVKNREWKPTPWAINVYPLLCEEWHSTREIRTKYWLPRREQREDCKEWLKANYPGRKFPRSACIGCPFHSNEEWLSLPPEEFADAVEFDHQIRIREREDARTATGKVRINLNGEVYIHRQLVPLDQVDLRGAGSKGGGCGTLFDGQDGMCGV